MANAESIEGEEGPPEDASSLEEPEVDEPEDSSPQTAEEIVSASLLSGSLTDICDVSVTVRSIDSEEEELVKVFADHGCKCEFGPHKSPCCKSFSADHYLSVRGAFMEMTHDELDLIIMGQITAHCFQSPSATSDSASTSPVEKKRYTTP